MPCLGYVACIRDFGDRGAIFWLHLILGFRIWGIGLRVYIGRCVCIYIYLLGRVALDCFSFRFVAGGSRVWGVGV